MNIMKKTGFEVYLKIGIILMFNFLNATLFTANLNDYYVLRCIDRTEI